MPDQVLDSLEAEYPSLAQVIADIRALRRVVANLGFSEFGEPMAYIEIAKVGKKETRSVIALDAMDIVAWTRHVAYGARVRMMALERGILRALADGDMLSAMTLTRSHMESAGTAAICLQVVSEPPSKEVFERIRDLLPKMLYGSSIRREANRNEKWERILDPLAFDTIRISALIDAMDFFVSTTGTKLGERRKMHYALLCEFAHPNMGSTRAFMQVKKETEHGFILEYGPSQDTNTVDTEMALSILFDNMRIGYASSEMLLAHDFKQTDGGIVLVKPSFSDAAYIWKEVLRLPEGPE